MGFWFASDIHAVYQTATQLLLIALFCPKKDQAQQGSQIRSLLLGPDPES
jgi:hypothetical protein